MVDYELESLLSVPNLYCIYLVDNDTYITLRTLLENFDDRDYSIPSRFRKYISKLINLYSSKKSIKRNVLGKTTIQKLNALKIKPLRPIFSRSGNTSYSVEDGISFVDDNKDLPYDKSISPFGELTFGEDRGNGFLNKNQTKFDIKFSAKIAAKQLKDNISVIRGAIGTSTESIWVVGRFDREDKTMLSFANILGTNTTLPKKIANISYSAEKPTDDWKKLQDEYKERNRILALQKAKTVSNISLPQTQTPTLSNEPTAFPPRLKAAATVSSLPQTGSRQRAISETPVSVKENLKSTSSKSVSSSESTATSKPPLPPPRNLTSSTNDSTSNVWERLVDVKTKKYYYYNTTTKKKIDNKPIDRIIVEKETISPDGRYYKVGEKTNWIKFNNKYYYKYLKYKQKYLEAKKLHGEKLEGGATRTVIFCPKNVNEVITKLFEKDKNFKDKEFFIFMMGPRSYYTVEKSDKLCSCWGVCEDNYWEGGLGTVKRKLLTDKFNTAEAAYEIESKINVQSKENKIKNYKYFYIESETLSSTYSINWFNLV